MAKSRQEKAAHTLHREDVGVRQEQKERDGAKQRTQRWIEISPHPIITGLTHLDPMRSYDCACSELKIAVHHLDLRGKSIKGLMSLKKKYRLIGSIAFSYILYIQTKTRYTDDYCSVCSLY